MPSLLRRLFGQNIKDVPTYKEDPMYDGRPDYRKRPTIQADRNAPVQATDIMAAEMARGSADDAPPDRPHVKDGRGRAVRVGRARLYLAPGERGRG